MQNTINVALIAMPNLWNAAASWRGSLPSYQMPCSDSEEIKVKNLFSTNEQGGGEQWCERRYQTGSSKLTTTTQQRAGTMCLGYDAQITEIKT